MHNYNINSLQATDDTFPGAFLLVSAGLIGICLFISIYFNLSLKGKSMKDTVTKANKNTQFDLKSIHGNQDVITQL